MMEKEMKERLIAAQKAEIDAVGMYHKIADALESETHKAMIMEIAADEGKHGRIIKGITNEIIAPDETKAAGTEMMIKTMGLKAVLEQFRLGELAGEKTVAALAEHYDEFNQIKPDERKHVEYLEKILAEI